MSGNQTITVGDRGRLVLPAEIRERRNITAGTNLIALDSDDGILLVTREQLKARVRADFADIDHSLVDELIEDRRAEAAREDADG